MILISIDLETTGLRPGRDQILELGAIAFDPEGDEKIATFHSLVRAKELLGQPYALRMNREIIDEIYNGPTVPRCQVLNINELDCAFSKWVNSQFWGEKPRSWTAVGKNFGSFDLQFMKHWLPTSSANIRHRCLDIGALMFDPETMERLPNLKQCLDIAEIDGVVSHNALEDADQVRCLTQWYYRE